MEVRPLLPLESETQFGKVVGVSLTAGERYYFLIDRHGVVSLMPADAVEPE